MLLIKGENKETLKEKISEKTKELKIKIKNRPIQSALIAIITVFISGLISQSIYSIAHVNDADRRAFSFLRAFIEWCTSIRGLICLLITIPIVYYIWKYLIASRQEVKTGIADERKFDYSDTGEYGTAQAMTKEDLKDILEFKDIEDTDGIILGETYDGEIVSIPTQREFNEKAMRNHWTQDDKTNNSRNRNLLVIGSPGTMKSRAIIMNQILQAMKIGDSIIVTDPKGELYEKTYHILTMHGYDVKMFNLVNQENSDAWNPLNELGGDSTYAKIFAETVVGNANEDGEQYWNDNAMNFFKACLMFRNSDTLGALYDFVSTNSTSTFYEKFSEMEDESVARRAYNIFEQCSDQVKGQIINGLGIMIDVFQDHKIRDITDTSEIDMTKPAREKCAYFVITSDQHRTFDYLAVLFWTMAFIKLVEYIDKNRDEKGDPTTRPVHLLLDEFPNIGAIPDFNRKLSTVRSRLLYSTIVIQNLPQLMNRYPNGMHEEIFSDCDFVVFLGCNDNTTAEYMSELTGTATINVATENYVFDKTKPVLNQNTEFRKVKSKGQRTVMNKDEIRSIKNTDLLIFIRGTKSVYQCKKFDYSKHPFAKDIKIVKIKDHVPDWKQAKIDAEIARQEEIAERKRQEAEIEAKKAENNRKALEAAAEAEKKAEEEKQQLEKDYSEFMDSEFGSAESTQVTFTEMSHQRMQEENTASIDNNEGSNDKNEPNNISAVDSVTGDTASFAEESAEQPTKEDSKVDDEPAQQQFQVFSETNLSVSSENKSGKKKSSKKKGTKSTKKIGYNMKPVDVNEDVSTYTGKSSAQSDYLDEQLNDKFFS